MKLELKHLAPYLPYGLIVEFEGTNGMIASYYYPAGRKFGMPPHEAWFNSGVLSLEDEDKDSELSCAINYKQVKPILRPLSDLTKEIEHNGEKFVPIIELFPLFFRKPEHAEMVCNQELDYAECHYYGGGALYINTNHILDNRYELIDKLFEWHFDVFGLIDKGLAIEKS